MPPQSVLKEQFELITPTPTTSNASARSGLLASLLLIIGMLGSIAVAIVIGLKTPWSFFNSSWFDRSIALWPVLGALIGYTAARFNIARPLFLLVCALALIFCISAFGSAGLLGLVALIICCVGIGSRIMGHGTVLAHIPAAPYAIASFALGTGVVATVLSLVLTRHVHYAAVYVSTTIVIAWWSRQQLLNIGRSLFNQARHLSQQTPSAPTAAALGALVPILALILLSISLPVAVFDDVAYHLRMPTELLERGYYTFDIRRSIWAIAPWNTDLILSFAHLLSQNADSTKSWLNLWYLVCTVVLLYAVVHQALERSTSRTEKTLLLVAAFLSTPIMVHHFNSLQTEPLSVVLVLSALWVWQQRNALGATGSLIGFYIVLGMLGSLKATNLLFSACLALLSLSWWLDLKRAQPYPPKLTTRAFVFAFLVATACSAVVALLPYVVAFIKTGNPVFPLFNGIFKSEYSFPENFANGRYKDHFTPTLLWHLLLQTPRFLETAEYFSGGLHLLLLPALVLLCVGFVRDQRLWLCLIAVGASAIVLSQQQYLRYVVPLLPLLWLTMSTSLDSSIVTKRFAQITIVAFVCLATAANTFFMPRQSWITGLKESVKALTPWGKDQYISLYAPERHFNATINSTFGTQARVLYLLNPFGAELKGKSNVLTFYSPMILKQFSVVSTRQELLQFFEKHRITHVVPLPTPAPPEIWYRKANELLLEYLKQEGMLVQRSNNMMLYRLADRHIWSTRLFAPEGRSVQVGNGIVTGGPIHTMRSILIEVEHDCSWETHPESHLVLEIKFDLKNKPFIFTSRAAHCKSPKRVAKFELDVPNNATDLTVVARTDSTTPATISRFEIYGLARDAY